MLRQLSIHKLLSSPLPLTVGAGLLVLLVALLEFASGTPLRAVMALAALLLLFVIFVGPTADIISGFFGNLAAYGEYLPALSMPFGREDA